MHLAKFFDRPPGDTDRELLLIPGGDPLLLGIHMKWEGEPGTEEYLREAGVAPDVILWDVAPGGVEYHQQFG